MQARQDVLASLHRADFLGPSVPTGYRTVCASTSRLCAPAPDIIGFKQSGRTRLLTQGFYTLDFLLNGIRFERLFVTGFDDVRHRSRRIHRLSEYRGSAGGAMTAGFEHRPGKRKAGLCVESGFAGPDLLAIVSIAAACVSVQDAERSGDQP
jgi:hypothetical protein